MVHGVESVVFDDIGDTWTLPSRKERRHGFCSSGVTDVEQ